MDMIITDNRLDLFKKIMINGSLTVNTFSFIKYSYNNKNHNF